MQAAPLKVLYIGGYSRSGSTILTNAVGEIEGCFGAGEVMAVWDQWLSSEARCGCGNHVSECPIWSPVLTEAFGEPDRDHFEEMRRLRNSEWQSAKIPRWLFQPSYRDQMLTRMRPYLESLGEIYRAIGTVVPDQIVVDSSKNPAYLYFLSQVSNVHLYFVHIVRDPRASAHSWKRQKEGFDSHGIWSSVKSWNARNAMLAMLGSRQVDRYMRIRYEDFAVDPNATLRSITAFADAPRSDFPFIEGETIHLTPNHLVYGNPDLFQTGELHLAPDNRWRNEMATRDQVMVAATSAPLMRRFGYELKPGDRSTT